MNIQKMMKQAQEMQGKMVSLQAKLEAEESEGASGGGAVRVTINGKGYLRKIGIDAGVIDPAEKEMLEDLILAAFNDAKTKADANAASEMQKLSGSMGLPPGMKLPF